MRCLEQSICGGIVIMDMDETLKEKEKVRRGTRGGTNEVGRTPNDHGKSHQTPNSIPSLFSWTSPLDYLFAQGGFFAVHLIHSYYFLRRGYFLPVL